MDDDLIYRQAAIAVADSSDYVGLSVEDCKKVTDEVVKGLRRLPPAQPERIRGRWVDKDGGLATCSACGDRWGVWSVMNFCPNCGADMRERNEQKSDDGI